MTTQERATVTLGLPGHRGRGRKEGKSENKNRGSTSKHLGLFVERGNYLESRTEACSTVEYSTSIVPFIHFSNHLNIFFLSYSVLQVQTSNAVIIFYSHQKESRL